jgi:hypothetical protein
MPSDDTETLDRDISYDQETKQLVREYPLEALRFYGRDEGRALPDATRVEFLQQEQISEHLGQGHRLVDVLPLVTLPDGRRQARAFMLEQTSRTGREVVFQVAEYLFKVGYWMEREYGITDIVPVIIFVHPTDVSTRIEYRSSLRLYGFVDCVACRLADLDAEKEIATGNLVAATNVMSMRYAPERKVALCTAAMRLWNEREEDGARVRKYGEHLLKCAGMTADERVEFFARIRAMEDAPMIRTVFDDLRDEGLREGIEKGIEKGREEGLQKGREEGRERGLEEGMVQGRAASVLELLATRQVEVSDEHRARIRECKDVDQLREWLGRAATAKTSADLFLTH